jgi:O-antigen/teichoic acid export membrane protein
MLGWGADSVILAFARGASEVAVFAVALRLFQFASQPFAILNAPLWAAYADATARHDTHFVRQTLRRSLRVSILGTAVISCLLLFAGRSLISLWTHGTIVVPTPLLALFAIWIVLDAGGNAFGVYLNGTGIVREQVWVVTAFCVLALPLKLVAATQFGAVGLVAATIVSYVIAVIAPYATVLRARVLRPMNEPVR